MMRLLHRMIPFIAISTLVTALPAGAQQRGDSTSTTAAVMSLLGLGGNIVGFGSASDGVSRQIAWNCGGGCAAFGVRAKRFTPFGEFVPSINALSPAISPVSPMSPSYTSSTSSKSSGLGYEGRSLLSPHEQADLSDYGWSRRVDTDGATLARVQPVPVEVVGIIGAADSDGSAEGLSPPPAPDGAGQAPRWAKPGSSPDAASAAMSRESPAPANRSTTAAALGNALPGPLQVSDNPITTFAVSRANLAPLVATVPEPSTVLLMAIGITSVLMIRSRRTNRR